MMISKRFGTKKTSKISKRVLGMESLENREMLNGVGMDYDLSDVVQTSASGQSQSESSMGIQSDEGTMGILAAVDAAPTAVTNSTASATGATSSAVTITWTKPTMVGTDSTDKVTVPKAGYIVSYIVKGAEDTTWKVWETTTKTTSTITGLDAAKDYIFKVESAITSTKTYTTATNVVVSSGTFKTEAADSTAVAVAVGPPTDVKTAFTKAGTDATTKPATIKVTWKAPANYTGAYTVTITDNAGTPVTKTFTVAAGAKTELILKITGTFDDAALTLANNMTYKVTVAAATTNKVASTATYCYTTADGKVSVTKPAKPTIATAPAALAGVPGGTTVTLPAGATDYDGYYVGLYTGTTAPKTPVPGVASNAYVYVAANATAPTVKLAATVDTGVSYVIWGIKDGVLSDATTGALVAGTGYTKIGTQALTGIAGALTVTQDTTTPTKYKVSWTAETAAAKLPKAKTPTETVTNQTINKFHVYVSMDGKTWQYVNATADGATVTLDVENVNAIGVKPQFKVVAEFKDTTDSDALTYSSKGVTATAAKEAYAKLVAPGKVAKPDLPAVPTETGATVNWLKVDNAAVTGYIVTVYDANKAVIETKVFTDNTTFTYTLTTALTPKTKYDVEVVATTADKLVKSPVQKISFTTVDYPALAAKVDSKSISMLDATVVIPKKTDLTGKTLLVEITSVADAKGVPDWNTATVETVPAAAETGYVPATTDKDGSYVIKAQLSPSTQYYVRFVVVDNATQADVKKVATGKEVKFKTVAAPLATIGKAGFNMTKTGDFGFRFDFKSATQNDKGKTPILVTDTTYTYELWVANDKAKADKDGSLIGGVSVATLTLTSPADAGDILEAYNDAKGVFAGYRVKADKLIKFSDVATKVTAAGGDISTWTGIQFQLKVKYTDPASGGAGNYATLFTKAGKLTFPKWYV